MKKIKLKTNKKKNTINRMFVVFFCAILGAIILFLGYTKNSNKKITVLIDAKINKYLYQIFDEKITKDIITKENINDILEITKNSRGEILTVNYNLEKTYQILNDIAVLLKKSVNDLENGKINVQTYDKYLESGPFGLILNVPFFVTSNNIFLNSLGPKIPVLVAFNETLLTNIKTKVRSYGFNNALLEIYVVTELKKTIITPLKEDESNFVYDILIGAMVVNGSVPSIYGNGYEANSSLFNLPLIENV